MAGKMIVFNLLYHMLKVITLGEHSLFFTKVIQYQQS